MFVNVKTNYAVSTFEEVALGEVFTLTDEDALPNGEVCMKISEITDSNGLNYNAVDVETGEPTYLTEDCAIIVPLNAELNLEY